MDFLMLRLDGPLMAFGAPMTDALGPTLEWPGLSLLTGLFANALGFDHAEADRTQALQARLKYGARADRRGKRIWDFQTVDLGQPHLMVGTWTTRGIRDIRRGASSEGTHIRRREYLADAIYTVAVGLDGDGEISLDELADALLEPERPLFFGRKPCLPAAPILVGKVQAPSVRAALSIVPAAGGDTTGDRLMAWWPEEEEQPDSRVIVVVDERDWANQIHVGSRMMRSGWIEVQNG